MPCLYYLSGLTCTDDNFINKGFGQYTASQLGIALIAPDTSPRGLDLKDEHKDYDFGSGAGFYVDATEEGMEGYAEHYQMYSYVTKELEEVLMSEENKEFFQCLQVKNKAVMGHSMGGHGALICALKTQGVFKSASAFSPICHPMNCKWGQKAFKGYLGSNTELWKEYDATVLAKTYSHPIKKQKLPILIDQGEKDEFYVKVDENGMNQLQPESFQQSCEQNNSDLDLTLNFREGYDHSYFFIASFIQQHIEFHAKWLLAK